MMEQTPSSIQDEPETSVAQLLASLSVMCSITLPLVFFVASHAVSETGPDYLLGGAIAASSWFAGALFTSIRMPSHVSSRRRSSNFSTGAVAASGVIAFAVVVDDAAVAWVLAPAVGFMGGWLTTAVLVRIWKIRTRHH